MINRKNLSQIKCIVVEVDGVLTDGKTWLSQSGVKQRKFSVRDSMAIRRLLKAGYGFVVTSKNIDKEITDHFSQLGVKYFFEIASGMLDLASHLSSHQTHHQDCAFIQFNSFHHEIDFGISVTVPNAASEVRTSVQHVTGSEGGDGALAEFAQLVLDHGSYSSQVTARKAVNI